MSLRENVTENNFHSVGVSGPLQNVNRLGCHIVSESYDQQLSDFDFKSVFLWSVPGFTYLLRFVSLFMVQRWKICLHGTDLYEHNTIKVGMTFWCTVFDFLYFGALSVNPVWWQSKPHTDSQQIARTWTYCWQLKGTVIEVQFSIEKKN